MPTLADYAYQFVQAGLSGGVGLVTQFKRVATTTQTNATVTLAATTTTNVLAANSNRLGAGVYNGTGQTVNLKLGPGASATSFTTAMASGAYYEVPFGWTGLITAFSTAASVAPHLQVTELTA